MVQFTPEISFCQPQQKPESLKNSHIKVGGNNKKVISPHFVTNVTHTQKGTGFLLSDKLQQFLLVLILSIEDNELSFRTALNALKNCCITNIWNFKWFCWQERRQKTNHKISSVELKLGWHLLKINIACFWTRSWLELLSIPYHYRCLPRANICWGEFQTMSNPEFHPQ